MDVPRWAAWSQIIGTALAALTWCGIGPDKLFPRLNRGSGNPRLVWAFIALSFSCGFYSIYFSRDNDQWSDKKEAVIGKTFINEKVTLDGKSFTDCTFENTTLEYIGTGPVDLVHLTFRGSCRVENNSKPALIMIRVLVGLGVIPSSAPIYSKDASGKIIPLENIEPINEGPPQ